MQLIRWSALVNPQVEWVGKETEVIEEGCLSLPNVHVDVERPIHVRARICYVEEVRDLALDRQRGLPEAVFGDLRLKADSLQVAQALIEHDLRRHAGIRAAEDDREGLLPRGQLGAARVTDEGVGVAGVREEAAIALAQPAQRFVSGDQPQAAASGCSWP